MYNRAKHIDTRVYRIRELSESGEVKIYKVAGENQPADIFTKSLPRPAFEKHRSSLMGNWYCSNDWASSRDSGDDKRYILSCIHIWLCLSRSCSLGSIFLSWKNNKRHRSVTSRRDLAAQAGY
jgi:hypothetical protein